MLLLYQPPSLKSDMCKLLFEHIVFIPFGGLGRKTC